MRFDEVLIGMGASLLFFLGFLVMPTAFAVESVVAFGDSITAGHPVDSRQEGDGCFGGCGGYEPPLQALIDQSGWKAIIYNWGVRGEVTSDGVARMDSVLEASHPQYVLLMEGTNDLWWIDPSSVVSNLFSMVTTIRQHKDVPVLMLMLSES